LLYILYGEDDYSIAQALGDIKRSIGDQSLLEANTTVLEGQRLSLDQLKSVSETVPFLAPARLVIIEGLMERFESQKPKSRAKRNKSQAELKSDYKPFADYLGVVPDSAVVVLIDGRIKNTNPLLKELSAKAKIKPFPLLKGERLSKWVEKEVASQGAAISPEAVDLLTRLVGGNLWIMASEINKLVSFALGRRIEVDDIQKIVSSAQESNVFAMVDAILDFKAGPAEQLLEDLLQRGASPTYLLAMLSRQVRLLVRAKELVRQRKSDIEIQNRMGLAPFPLRKTMEQAQRYPIERLKDVYLKLLEADLSIKWGKYDGKLALNILIAELCPQVRA
jgi:DNA polymerase-3 subunit delta